MYADCVVCYAPCNTRCLLFHLKFARCGRLRFVLLAGVLRTMEPSCTMRTRNYLRIAAGAGSRLLMEIAGGLIANCWILVKQITIDPKSASHLDRVFGVRTELPALLGSTQMGSHDGARWPEMGHRSKLGVRSLTLKPDAIWFGSARSVVASNGDRTALDRATWGLRSCPDLDGWAAGFGAALDVDLGTSASSLLPLLDRGFVI
ncbi:hypothetical protein ACLOJK_029516 [Asimina triloba]